MRDISRSRIHYYVLCIGAFASHSDISPAEAFTYLYTYKGIDFLIECYDAEHTLSLNDAVEDLATVCNNNGGTLGCRVRDSAEGDV